MWILSSFDQRPTGEGVLPEITMFFFLFCSISSFPNLRLKSGRKCLFLECFSNFLPCISHSGCQPEFFHVKRTLTNGDYCDHFPNFIRWQQEWDLQGFSAPTLDTWHTPTHPLHTNSQWRSLVSKKDLQIQGAVQPLGGIARPIQMWAGTLKLLTSTAAMDMNLKLQKPLHYPPFETSPNTPFQTLR